MSRFMEEHYLNAKVMEKFTHEIATEVDFEYLKPYLHNIFTRQTLQWAEGKERGSYDIMGRLCDRARTLSMKDFLQFLAAIRKVSQHVYDHINEDYKEMTGNNLPNCENAPILPQNAPIFPQNASVPPQNAESLEPNTTTAGFMEICNPKEMTKPEEFHSGHIVSGHRAEVAELNMVSSHINYVSRGAAVPCPSDQLPPPDNPVSIGNTAQLPSDFLESNQTSAVISALEGTFTSPNKPLETTEHQREQSSESRQYYKRISNKADKFAPPVSQNAPISPQNAPIPPRNASIFPQNASLPPQNAESLGPNTTTAGFMEICNPKEMTKPEEFHSGHIVSGHRAEVAELNMVSSHINYVSRGAAVPCPSDQLPPPDNPVSIGNTAQLPSDFLESNQTSAVISALEGTFTSPNKPLETTEHQREQSSESRQYYKRISNKADKFAPPVSQNAPISPQNAPIPPRNASIFPQNASLPPQNAESLGPNTTTAGFMEICNPKEMTKPEEFHSGHIVSGHRAEVAELNMVSSHINYVSRGAAVPCPSDQLPPPDNPVSIGNTAQLPSDFLESNQTSAVISALEGTFTSPNKPLETTEHQREQSSESRQYYKRISNKADKVYKMDSSPRGHCLIINNEKFEYFSIRRGSSKDMEKLDRMFRCLGFEILLYQDKTAREMTTLLEDFSKSPALVQISSLAVVILSHGGPHESIYGTDGAVVGKSPVAGTFISRLELQHIFNGTNCPPMIGKPKLFILQACRGDMEDDRDRSNLGVNDQQESHISRDGLSLGHTKGDETESDHPWSDDGHRAETADMCFLHSSSLGYTTYRYTIEGSPFIQHFTEEVMKHASEKSFQDMVMAIQKDFSTKRIGTTKMTMPEYFTCLTRKWYFNPPVGES